MGMDCLEPPQPAPNGVGYGDRMVCEARNLSLLMMDVCYGQII